jgi:hypothetical protein
VLFDAAHGGEHSLSCGGTHMMTQDKVLWCSQSVWQWLAQFSTPLSRAPAGAAAEAEAKLRAEAQVRRACHRTLLPLHTHMDTSAHRQETEADEAHHCCSPHTAPDEDGSCPAGKRSSLSSHFMLP